MTNRIPHLVEHLKRFSTLAELRDSAFYAESRAELEAILMTPEIIQPPSVQPRLRSFLRVVQWNIEKGRQLRGILDSLRRHDVMRRADVILLNEADRGMARSGNVHVARTLAEGLGMGMAFGPAHLELTRGTGEEALLEEENAEALQGNAVLSRYPILEARVTQLPRCFEPFEFHEKRFGGRNCLWALIEAGSRPIWVGAIHLEVRNTPACRARQMRHLLSRLPGEPGSPCILGGDLNTNGFARGTRWRTMRSVLDLVSRSPEDMRYRLRRPQERREPLFRIAKDAGFVWEGLNSDEATSSVPLDDLEDAGLLPPALVRWIRRRLDAYGGQLDFKLDWLLARGVTPLRQGEARDDATGDRSLDPGALRLERNRGPERLSDHSPVCADLRLPGATPPDPQARAAKIAPPGGNNRE